MPGSNIVKVQFIGDSKSLQSATKAVEKDIGGVEKATEGVSKTLTGFATALGGAFATRKVLGFASDSIKAASDLDESINKTKELFEGAAGQVVKFSEGAADSIGQSQGAALEAATTFAVFGKAAGKTGGDLADFSIDMTKLASDLASFHNTSPEEAVYALGAALRGEYEPARKYGYQLNEIAIKQQAMEMGIYSGTGAIDAQTKTLAVAELLYKDAGDAVGDFSRTSDGLANQQRILAARFEDVKVELGRALLPAVQMLLTVVGNLLSLWQSLPPELRVFIGISAIAVAGTIAFATAMSGLAAALEAAGIGLSTFTGPVGLAALGIGALVGAFSVWTVHSQEQAQANARMDDALREVIPTLEDYTDESGNASDATSILSDAQQTLAEILLKAADLGDDFSEKMQFLGLGQQDLINLWAQGEDAVAAYSERMVAATGAGKDLIPVITGIVTGTEDLDGAALGSVDGLAEWVDENADLYNSLLALSGQMGTLSDDAAVKMLDRLRSMAWESGQASSDFEKQAEAVDGVTGEIDTFNEVALVLQEYQRLINEANKDGAVASDANADAMARAAQMGGQEGEKLAMLALNAQLYIDRAGAATTETYQLTTNLDRLGSVLDDASVKAYQAKEDYDALQESLKRSTIRGDAWAETVTNAWDTQTFLMESTGKVSEALRGLADSDLPDVSAGFDVTTEAGWANYEAVTGVAKVMRDDLIGAVQDGNMTLGEARDRAEVWRSKLVETATQLGLDKDQTDALVDSLGVLDRKDVDANVKLTGEQIMMTQIDLIISNLDYIDNSETRHKIVLDVLRGDFAGAVADYRYYFSTHPAYFDVVPVVRGQFYPGGHTGPVAHGGNVVDRAPFGATVNVGQPVLVGDRGSRGEMFFPSTTGKIVPDYEWRRAVTAAVESVSDSRSAAEDAVMAMASQRAGGTTIINVPFGVRPLDVKRGSRRWLELQGETI